MRNKFLFSVAMATCLGFHCNLNAENVITWETLGNGYTTATGNKYIQRFTINADRPFERFAFCAFKRGLKPVNPSDSVIEILPGYVAVSSDRFKIASPDSPIVVDLISDGSLHNISFAPDGMHLVADGKPVRATNVRKSIVDRPAQYSIPTQNGVIDPMIYGDKIFAINDSLRSSYRPAPYMTIPTPKSVKLTGKNVARPSADNVKIVKIKNPHTDYYRVSINGPRMTVYTNSQNPEGIVASVMKRIDASVLPDGRVPGAIIEDWADLPYRGLMIDVARNFTNAEDMRSLIDLMADYGLNVLHFHVGDDEGWRVEIPELPELTEIASRRGYTTTDDTTFLKQIYSGDGNPDATDTPANGFYTVDQYIDLLKYAKARGIDIIPEFDSPGHSRAAIIAMEQRYKKTGDKSLRLIHDGDTSKYTTAQDFHDNLMNPALDGPYKFWDIVIKSLKDTYSKAGVPLLAVHIGGDEVPNHAWDGSEYAQKLMKDKGMTHQRELHAYFVERVGEIADNHGVKIAGWQEIALDHSADYDRAMLPRVGAVNCWTNAGDFGQRIASQGYPLILSNVDYLYFDHVHTSHPEEPGMTWGGIVDEFQPLHATIDQLCPASPEVQKNVKGISAHLFAETVRSRAMIERYILPRILGLAERAHNINPTLSDSEYFGALTAEMDNWVDDNRNFFVRQPGVRVNDGKIEMNNAYGNGEIRYTIDGTTPTRQSALYTAPVDASGIAQVKARLFYGDAESVTTILNID